MRHRRKPPTRYQKYYTYRARVPRLRPGEKIDFKMGKGFFIRKPPQPPKPVEFKPPRKAYDLHTVQRCLFLTGDISHALDTHNRLLIATADPGYRKYYTHDFLQQAIAQDRLRVWCDCRMPNDPVAPGTPPSVALAWLRDLGLPESYFYGQCENPQEFDLGFAAGARKFVGIASALTGTLDDPNSQLGKVESGEVLMSNETYFNKNRNYNVDWRNADGIGSNCQAVYASSTEGAEYYSLEDQARDGKANPSIDCYYVASFRESDWQFIISH